MRKPGVFITGLPGFAGSYLAEELLAAGFEIAGNRYKGEPIDNISAIRSNVKLISLDILDADRCRRIIERIKPHYIFHLAAFASVGKSFSLEQTTFRVNVEGTINVLEAARRLGGLKRLVIVSSSDCYGRFTPKSKTLTENQPLNPVSPYGISKAAAEQISLYYHRQYGLPIIIARAFNHSGPRQLDRYVIPSFCKQIAQIEAGIQKPLIEVGNLRARRDLSDVRDIVRGYRLLTEKGKVGEVYQLCSGRAVAIQTVLDMLLRMSTREIAVKTDKSRLRKADIPVLRGSYAKAARQVGYDVRYSLRNTLSDTLDYWRKLVGG
jgi:GDP-4-dehydro-6-deoxy-D-mannose reductase